MKREVKTTCVRIRKAVRPLAGSARHEAPNGVWRTVRALARDYLGSEQGSRERSPHSLRRDAQCDCWRGASIVRRWERAAIWDPWKGGPTAVPSDISWPNNQSQWK